MSKQYSGKLAEVNHEVEGDFKLSAWATQFSNLTTRITKVEAQCRFNGKFRLSLENRRFVGKGSECINNPRLLILQNLHEQTSNG